MNCDSSSVCRRYSFGPYTLDPTRRLLWRDGPKTVEVLSVLVERHGTIVEKDDLLRFIWSNAGRRGCGERVISLSHGRDEHVAAAWNGRDEIVLSAPLPESLAEDRDVTRQVVLFDDDDGSPSDRKEMVEAST